MKSPHDIADELARQWKSADTREKRLLMKDSWPLKVSIGKPASGDINHHPEKIRQHFQQWRQVNTGEVIWNSASYRGMAESIEIPGHWLLSKPSEWIEASRCKTVKDEYQRLGTIIQQTSPIFHPYLIRQRRWFDKPVNEVIKTTELAMLLEPGFAQGVPLRSLGLANTDTKFFERNASLLRQLLDIRFDGLPSKLGLEAFLNAPESHHWLLIADLDGSFLPFQQLRVRDYELSTTPLPAANILIVENEQCLHLIPSLKNTIAILGAGLNLSWMKASWLHSKSIAYWGDMDSWGLTMLARARNHQPSLSALLMNQSVFDMFQEDRAVEEPVPSIHEDCTALKEEEQQFLNTLRALKRGRLEQEFLTAEVVHSELKHWCDSIQ
ncbi:Wadjet anti-phage system protein JetD domain-containing protein [Endozoicomonas elysicola]|uniref:Wadjet protein JetD C-terminal domain-containing protein n=1 Tax=Endozoicomonas elysicola TaxID=305900 RepID=A0A081KFS1_9GAMM|nr:Wadjet anti-phage system protein JetD domain-containing protein [Endozoicomonas elysicola]KEI72997.1 hypothetical protein GV64_21775 [Endozoicomonas elysicola]